jgi:hypothetical protein
MRARNQDVETAVSMPESSSSSFASLAGMVIWLFVLLET